MSDPVSELSRILGPKGWLSGSDAEPYVRDWLNRCGMTPLGVARPVNTDEVAAVVRVCARSGIPLVPQGGNTGLCGGAVADRSNALILSLSRMTAIDEPDQNSGSI